MGYFLPELSVAERIAMPVIKLEDQQFLLRPGTNRLGGGDFVELTVSPDVSLGVQAIIEVTGTEGVVIRPVSGKEAVVLVNGVLLTDPTPLLHGDKLEVAGKELSFSDDSKTGATTFVSRAEIAAVTAAAKAPAPPGPKLGEPIQLGDTVRGPASRDSTEQDGADAAASMVVAATGGRLVSLVDGREYPVPQAGLVIGRESGSDVVLAQKQVSRKHADHHADAARLRAERSELERRLRERHEDQRDSIAGPHGHDPHRERRIPILRRRNGSRADDVVPGVRAKDEAQDVWRGSGRP